MATLITGNVIKGGNIIVSSNINTVYEFDTGTNLSTALSPGYVGFVHIANIINIDNIRFEFQDNTGVTAATNLNYGTKLIFQNTGANTWVVYSI